MSVDTWQNMPKTTTDNTTVVEEITTLIEAHNDDPDAHLGDDQALKSHRAAEIIDHLAESIYADKMHPSMRIWDAVVDTRDEVNFQTIADAVEYCNGIGGGNILVQRGIHILATGISIAPSVSLHGVGIDETVIKADTNEIIPFLVNGYPEWPGINATYLTVTEGSNVIELADLVVPSGYSVIGLSIEASNGINVDWLRITGQNDATHFTVDHNAAEDYVTDAPFFNMTFTLTKNSNTVTLYGTNTIDQMNIVQGMSLVDNDGLTAYKIIEIIDDNVFEIYPAFKETTQTYMRAVRYLTSVGLEVHDLTIQNEGALPFFQGVGAPASIYCDNIAYRGTGYVNDASCPIRTISNSILECDDSACLLAPATGRIIDCDFVAQNDSAVAISGAMRFDAQGCRFLANGYIEHLWVQFYNEAATLERCLFESCGDWHIATSPGVIEGLPTKILGNTFYIEGGSTLYLDTSYATFNNNAVYGDEECCVLSVQSNNTVAVGNITTGAILDDGADNTVGYNGLY